MTDAGILPALERACTRVRPPPADTQSPQAAGARVGEATYLTTAELVERVDAERPAVEQALVTPRFDDQAVLKCPRLGDDTGSEWRIDSRDDDADYLTDG